jgi:hypothetical protein
VEAERKAKVISGDVQDTRRYKLDKPWIWLVVWSQSMLGVLISDFGLLKVSAPQF